MTKMFLSLEPSTGMRFAVEPVATMSCSYGYVSPDASLTWSASKSIETTS